MQGEFLRTDLTAKEESKKSEYVASYHRKDLPENFCLKHSIANHCHEVNYTRNVQEKVI